MPRCRPSAAAGFAAAAAVVFAAVASPALAATDRSAYDRVAAAARTTYDGERQRCDALSGNAKDVCAAQAKLKRVRAEAPAEAAWRDTPKARAEAVENVADAEFGLAKAKCEARAGNDKDVCVRQADAVRTRVVADAKARRSSTEAAREAADAKRKAEFKVAEERCGAFGGDTRDACVARARARYGR